MMTERDPAAATARASTTTIGVTGLRPRWSVSGHGAVERWPDDAWPSDMVAPDVVDWFVAADDRWHVPAHDPTIRQRRIEGTPVLETRIRIPDGDAIQRVWAVPERGGMVVVEFENESPLPIAVAVSGTVITERPPAAVPIQGIELPDDAIVLPVGHHATVRVLVPSEPTETHSTGLAPVPPSHLVVSGWLRTVERASRLVTPDEALAEAVAAARCDLLLDGPVDPSDDPAGFLLDVAEMVRCGDEAESWLLDVVAPAEQIGRSGAAVGSDAVREHVDALVATRSVAARAGDQRAVGDLDRLIAVVAGQQSPRRRILGSMRRRRAGAPVSTPLDARPGSFADARRGASAGRFVRSIERRFADVDVAEIAVDDVDGGTPGRRVRLLPAGLPTAWLGGNLQVHEIPTGPDSSVSFGIRWHGERPALLWEQHGRPALLTAPVLAPDWSASDTVGETLWPAPPSATTSRRSLGVSAISQTPAEPGPAQRVAENDTIEISEGGGTFT